MNMCIFVALLILGPCTCAHFAPVISRLCLDLMNWSLTLEVALGGAGALFTYAIKTSIFQHLQHHIFNTTTFLEQ